nr:DUF6583 family protein [Mammaliicoccus sp. Marseille-Q6498]
MSTKVKVLIIGIVVAFLAVVGIGGAATYYFLTNTPKNTYLKSEQESAKSWKEYFNNRFENETKFQDKMKDESYVSTMKLGADVPDSLLSALSVPKSVVDSSNLVFNIGHDPKEKNSKLGIEPTIADKKIGNFQWSADKNNQYLETPLFDKIYKVKNNEIKKGIEKASGQSLDSGDGQEVTNDSMNLNTILSSSQVSQDDIDKISKRYSDLIVDNLDDDNFKKDKEKVKIFGDEKDLKKVTMNLSSKDTKKIVVAVLEQAKKDEDVKNIAEKQGNVKSYDKSIKDLLKKAKDKKASEYPKINSIIYVDGKQILKRDLTITNKDNKKLKLVGTNVIDKGVQVDYKVTMPGEDGSVTLKGKSTDGDNMSDKYNLDIKQNEYQKTSIKFDNKSKVDGDKRNDKGKFTFSEAYGDPMVVNYNHDLTTDTKNNQQKQKLGIDFDVSGEKVKLNLDGKTELKKDVKFKKDGAVDFNSLSQSEVDDISKEIEDKLGKIGEDLAKELR